MGLGFGLRFWAQVLGFGFRTVALAAALTTHCCSTLLNAAQDTWRRGRRARGAEQRRHTGQGVAQCRRVAAALWIVGVDVVLAVFLAFLPFYDQYCSRAREELHRP